MKPAEIQTEFEEEFWPAVPHKIGKGAARRAYARARGIASKEDIVAGLKIYACYEQWRQKRDGDKYRPLHPSTWLNQGRWSDEWQPPAQEQSTRRTLDAFWAKQEKTA